MNRSDTITRRLYQIAGPIIHFGQFGDTVTWDGRHRRHWPAR